MSVLFWMVLGGVVGWLVSRSERSGDRRVLLLLVAGFTGAIASGVLVPWSAADAINYAGVHLPAPLVSLAAGASALVVVRAVHRWSLR